MGQNREVEQAKALNPQDISKYEKRSLKCTFRS